MNNLEQQVTIKLDTAPSLSVMDFGMEALQAVWLSGGLWLLLALPLAMQLTNIFKPVVRDLVPHRTYRRLGLFLMAYLIGYGLGVLLIDSPDSWKWAIFIGVINPVVYQYMLNRAIANDNLARIALLKGRQLTRKSDGELSVDETQKIHIKRGRTGGNRKDDAV